MIRNNVSILICIMAWAFASCSPKITSNIIHRDKPQEWLEDVVVLKEKDPLPDDAEWMGTIDMKGKVSYDKMAEKIRFKAWEEGGKYVKIKSYGSDGVRSDIHVMKSDVFRSDSADVHFTYTPMAVNPQTPVSESDNRWYVYLGGEGELAYSVNAHSGSVILALGVGYFVTPSLSLGLGIDYSFTSENDINVRGKGLSASMAYHIALAHNLYIVPQAEVDYLNYHAYGEQLNYVGVALAPFVFEYRSDNRLWGFQAGIGQLGVAFPVSGTELGLKSFFSVNLNSVSLGFVRYF